MMPKFQGWSDFDYTGDSDDRKITFDYVFMFGSRSISCSSKKQPVVTLSTTRVGFVTITLRACQDIWLKKIIH